jgi:Na+/proline symporter
VVFSGTSGAATFVAPTLMTAYWRRATAAGTIAAMLAGMGTVLALYALGWIGFDQNIGEATRFGPYYLLGLHPIVWGLAASFVAGIAVSRFTSPPDPERVSLFFDAQTPAPLVQQDGKPKV